MNESSSSKQRSLVAVIPTFNSEDTIGKCIESIVRQSTPASQIIVVDGGSNDLTESITRSYGIEFAVRAPNRSAQRNEGARLARGDLLLFIDSDMRLAPDVIEVCIDSFHEDVAALRIPEVDVGTSFWAKVRGFERSLMKDVDWVKAARCFRRNQFISIRGFDVGLVGFEDWDLDERIRKFGQVIDIDTYVEHNEGSIRLSGLIQKKSHYAQSITVFRERHPSRANQALSGIRRALVIFRQPQRLILHPLLSSGLLVVGSLEILVSRVRFRLGRRRTIESPLHDAQNPLVEHLEM